MEDPYDPLTTPLEDSAQVAAAKRAELQEVEDMKWLMAHAQGRRIVARIFKKTGIRRTPFNTNNAVMSFNAGQQNIGLWLESEVISASPEGHIRLLKEFRNE